MFILLSNPFSILLPKKARQVTRPLNWQFHIRQGDYPKIHLYIASAFLYESPDQARYHAERYCQKNGIDIMRVNVYTISKHPKKPKNTKENKTALKS